MGRGSASQEPRGQFLEVIVVVFMADARLQERQLVRKLDFGILICATLGWWMKYIDQANISNACECFPEFVSGKR